VVVIARTSGTGAFQLTDRVGVVRPAHCTALGKIILASLRPDQLKRFLERVELKPSTGKSITNAAVLLREIAEIRRSAIAFDDGEFNPEVRCVAVPVYHFTGEVIGALGISGPIWRMTDQILQSRAKLVQAAAGRLSADSAPRIWTKAWPRPPEIPTRCQRVRDASGVDRRNCNRKHHTIIEKRILHDRMNRYR